MSIIREERQQRRCFKDGETLEKFGGRSYCESTAERGVFVWLLSSNINNLSAESLTLPLINQSMYNLLQNASLQLVLIVVIYNVVVLILLPLCLSKCYYQLP